MGILFWWILSTILVGGVLVVKIYGLITKDKIRNHLDDEGKNKGKKLYGNVTKIYPNKVTVKIIDTWGDKVEEVEYNSKSGVSSYIREGDHI